jgi:hypothetical protein
MSLPLAATTEQIEESRAWIRDFYHGIKSPDMQNWIDKFYQPDAVFNFGNRPPCKGLKDICGSFEKEREHVLSIKHDIIHADVFFDRIYVQKKDTFIVKNDPEQKEIVIKALVVIWKKADEDKLSAIDVYLDSAPLIERIKLYN